MGGVVYQTRRDTPHIHGNLHGYVTKCNVYVSKDNRDYVKVAEGEWLPSHASRQLRWGETDARYLKFEVVDGTNGEASVGELSVITK